MTGFTQPDPAARDAAAAAGAPPPSALVSEDALADLCQRKAELLAELSAFSRAAGGGGLGLDSAGDEGGMAADTAVSARVEAHPERGVLELVLESNNPDTCIKAVAVFAEQLFDSESLLRVFKARVRLFESIAHLRRPVSHSTTPTPSPLTLFMFDRPRPEHHSPFELEQAPSSVARIPLASKRDVACDVLAKVIVGTLAGRSFICVDVEVSLGKYAMYIPVREPLPEPQGRVQFRLAAPAQKFAAW